jgi:hypothetical protein
MCKAWLHVVGLSLIPRSAANISMLDEINGFFDELRTPFEWPDHFPEIDPISNVNIRAHCEKHHHLAMLALDKTEFHLLEIYRAGGDSATAIDFLDGVIAIIRRDDSAEERMLAIGRFLQQQESRAVKHKRQRLQPAIGTA